jgi:hypothetical protein
MGCREAKTVGKVIDMMLRKQRRKRVETTALIQEY